MSNECVECGEELVRSHRLPTLRLWVLKGVALVPSVDDSVVHDLALEAEGECVGVVVVPALTDQVVPITHHPVLGERVGHVLGRDGGMAQLRPLSVIHCCT